MDIAILGVNVPAPPIPIKKELLEEYARLYKGIRSRKDTVTWRTFIITTKRLLGAKIPEIKPLQKSKLNRARKLVGILTKRTYMEKLTPEIMYSLGLRGMGGRKPEDLDYLLVNGRHFPEPLLWALADYVKGKGKSVAVINPVGHYNDGQTRVIGPAVLTRKVRKLVVLASTQAKQGGSISVLSNVIRIIRNKDFTDRVEEIDIVLPMFGGSRGHRIGQSEKVGFEVMEAGFNAKLLSLPTRDLLEKLNRETNKIPKVRFFSIDIHDDLYPAKVFKEEGFDFISIDPSSIFAEEIITLIKNKKYRKFPIRIAACDEGAIPRTENLARRILSLGGRSLKDLQIIYLDKKRIRAGIVSAVKFKKIEKWSKDRKKIKKRSLKIPQKPIMSRFIFVYSDDMIDTGGTAQKDIEYISSIFPNPIQKIFIATHPVFSKGFSAIKRIGADIYFVGNTLGYDGLSEIRGVRVVDMAPAIYKEISR